MMHTQTHTHTADLFSRRFFLLITSFFNPSSPADEDGLLEPRRVLEFNNFRMMKSNLKSSQKIYMLDT